MEDLSSGLGDRCRYLAFLGDPKMRVPAILLNAMSKRNWPKGRVPGSSLVHTHRLFREIDFELLQTEKQLERNGIADTHTLLKFADNPNICDKLGLEIDVANSDLPKLDVNHALVFGGGADIGDDFWLTLDLRTEFDNPRVVGNHFQHRSCEWFEIASTFSQFCEFLELA